LIFLGLFDIIEDAFSLSVLFDLVLLVFDLDCLLECFDFVFFEFFSVFDDSSSDILLLLELLCSNFSFNFSSL